MCVCVCPSAFDCCSVKWHARCLHLPGRHRRFASSGNRQVYHPRAWVAGSQISPTVRSRKQPHLLHKQLWRSVNIMRYDCSKPQLVLETGFGTAAAVVPGLVTSWHDT